MEADWQRHYGRDLPADLYGPQRLSARRIANLIHWLPPDSATWRATGYAWDIDTELQATTVEILDRLLHAYVQTHSKKKITAEPLKIPRPWDKTAGADGKRPGTTLAELAKQGLTIRQSAE